jgi:hypothetical protein
VGRLCKKEEFVLGTSYMLKFAAVLRYGAVKSSRNSSTFQRNLLHSFFILEYAASTPLMLQYQRHVQTWMYVCRKHTILMFSLPSNITVIINTGSNNQLLIYKSLACHWPIPVAVRSKVWVYGRCLTATVSSNPTADMDVCLLWVLCVVR